MKALSLHQPWASLVAAGAKRMETRSWATHYRGPLAIHAAKRWGWEEQAEHCQFDPLRAAFASAPGVVIAGHHTDWALPLGAVIAVAELTECWLIRPADLFDPVTTRARPYAGARELAYGDFAPGRYAWELENIRPIEPVPFRGAHKLFEFEGPVTFLRPPLKSDEIAAAGLFAAALPEDR